MSTTTLQQEDVQLAMARQHLENLPPVTLNPGYHLRSFKEGDEAGWDALIQETFASSDNFEEIIAGSPLFAPERVWFIEYDGQIVATASAWRAEKWGAQTGVLHMVGASPQHRGQRLGYMVSLAVLQQFVREGLCHAVLQTDDFRLPAIVTYLKLGFAPLLIDRSHPTRWEKVYNDLNIK